VTQHFEGAIIDPSLARAEHNHPDVDSLRVGLDIAGNFKVVPLRLANRTVVHIVEETHLAVPAIHAEPELSPISPIPFQNGVNANGGTKADSFATIRCRVEALHEVSESPWPAFSTPSKFCAEHSGLRLFGRKFRHITGRRNHPALRGGARLTVFESKVLGSGLSSSKTDQDRQRCY